MNEKKEILVSIIIPCFNHGAYIQNALDSIELNNSDDYFEIIIVDDGSTDSETIEKLEQLQQKNYTIIHQTNKGAAAARNVGIDMAKGEFILPLDADNKINPNYYRKAIQIFKTHPEVGIVYSDRKNFGLEDNHVVVGEYNLQQLLAGNYIDNCAVFRKKVWEDNQGYDESPQVSPYEDWEFWINASKKNWKFHYIPEVLFEYRVLPVSNVSKALDGNHRYQILTHITSKHSSLYEKYYSEIIADLHRVIASWDLKSLTINSEIEKIRANTVVDKNEYKRLIEELNLTKNHSLNLESKVSDLEKEISDYKLKVEDYLNQLHTVKTEKLLVESQLSDAIDSKNKLINELVAISAKLEHIQSEVKLKAQHIRMLDELLLSYEARIKSIEDTRTWRIRKQYYKFKGIFKSKKSKGFRIPGLGFIKKIIFFTFGNGKIITRRLFKKVFKNLYLWLEEFPVRIIPVSELSKQTISIGDPYHEWMMKNFPREAEFRQYKKEMEGWKTKPLISIILPVYNPPIRFFKQTLDSVISQIYDNWELCIADDCSTNKEVKKVIDEYAKKDYRIKVTYRKENGHISAASNTALEMTKGDFSLLLDHDDLLRHDCIFHVAKKIIENPKVDLIYSDEDKIDENGVHKIPHFKPQWCPDNFTSRNYFGHVVVGRTKIFKEIGGFRLGYEGSQDYDILLRFIEKTNNIEHIPMVLYHWRIHSESAASGEEAKPYAYVAAQKALAEHFERIQEPAKVDFLPGMRGYSIRYELKEKSKISIIIPTKDNTDVLKVCIDSIYQKSSYQNFEIILISNNSTDKKLFNLLNNYQANYPDSFKWFEYNVPFNYSKLMNFGREKSSGEYLLLLNNDTEVITKDWMEAMLEQAQRKTSGAVGVKLLYPDNTIQHAGVIIGLGGIAGHSFVALHKDEAGYFNYIQSINNYAAVTAACLMIETKKYDAVNGFNEDFEVEYNDVDFCLKLKEKGWHNIYLPHVELYHYESLTRGHPHMNEESYNRHVKEMDKFKKYWQKYIDDDPCYNPNLTRGAHDFRLAL